MPDMRLPDSADLKAVLEHVRSQFQYHARQRLESIRYFFAALALFSVAYVNAHITGSSASPILPLVLSITALLVTLAFWALDYRNAQMVEIDELALQEIEKEAGLKYSLINFEAIEACRKPYQFRRYGNVMKILFGYFSLMFSAIMIVDAMHFLSICSSRHD